MPGNVSPSAAAFTSRTVSSDSVELATRDFGGDGPPLVLMHGAGATQTSLEPLVTELAPTYRVVTFDFRGHGDSDRGPWTFDTAVQDLAAVISAYRLDNPAVAGHSLGGMIAAVYGVQHPECPGAVNIDGHGLGRVEQYVGMDEAAVRSYWSRQQRKADRLILLASGLVPLLKLLHQPTPPPRSVTRQVLAAVDEADLFAIYRQLTCPLLVFNCTADEDRKLALRMIGAEGLAMLRAYRAGLRRDLEALAAEHANVHVVEVEATHMAITSHPGRVAQLVDGFLTDQRQSRHGA